MTGLVHLSPTIHKDSGIVNDANLWAIETIHNSRYPQELLLLVVAVSVKRWKSSTGYLDIYEAAKA